MSIIIDAHVHVGRHVAPTRGHDATADLIAGMDDHDVTASFVSSLGDTKLIEFPTVEELQAANRHVRELMAVHPGRLYGMVYVSPDHIDASLAEIERYVANGPFVGIKLWVAAKASDPRLDPLIEYASELEAVVLQHAWDRDHPAANESTPADVAVMASRHPDATIQMAHLIGAREHGVRRIAEHPRVLVDTSGGSPERGMVEYAIEHLGHERVIFGSDVPIRDLATQFTKVLGDDLDDEQRRAILGENAVRWYPRFRRQSNLDAGEQP